MATAMVTLTWCDRHLTDTDEEVPGDAMPPWADGLAVDLCPECAAPVLAARELAEHYGAIGKRTPEVVKGRRPLVPSSRADAQPVAGGLACPDCGAKLSNRQSLGSHARNIHGKSLGELEGKPLNYVCPTCQQGFTTPQGVAVHARVHEKG